jgi:hypothetical protein
MKIVPDILVTGGGNSGPMDGLAGVLMKYFNGKSFLPQSPKDDGITVTEKRVEGKKSEEKKPEEKKPGENK